jgi:hypothetical protein
MRRRDKGSESSPIHYLAVWSNTRSLKSSLRRLAFTTRRSAIVIVRAFFRLSERSLLTRPRAPLDAAVIASGPELSWSIGTNFRALATELELLYLEIDAGLRFSLVLMERLRNPSKIASVISDWFL